MAHGTHEKPVRVVGKKNIASRLVKAEPKGPAKIVRKFKELARRELWSKSDPDHHVDWSDDRVWEKIKVEGCYHRADEMLVSCGTVTIDQPDSPQPKVLVIYNSNIGIYQLPKGRKNFGEGHLEAALRETAEETGVAAKPLRLKFGSRSTPPKLVQTPGQSRGTRYSIDETLTGVTEALSNEAVGVSEYPDPATGAWRHHYWYAAKPLGATERDENQMTEEEDRQKFSTFWLSEMDAVSLLKLEDEKFMVRITFAYLRNMSASDWASNGDEEGRIAKANTMKNGSNTI